MTPASLRHLSREECFELLGRARLGRVALEFGALPAILPVNYSLFEGDVVLRTAPGSKLSAAIMGTLVAFEVDAADGNRSGWSVLVVGHATEILDAASLEQVRGLALESWAPDARDHFVRISAEHVTGRAFGA